MIYVIDTTTATADSLGTVLSGHGRRSTAETGQRRAAKAGYTQTAIIGIGRRWHPGKPAPKAEYQAWRDDYPREEV